MESTYNNIFRKKIYNTQKYNKNLKKIMNDNLDIDEIKKDGFINLIKVVIESSEVKKESPFLRRTIKKINIYNDLESKKKRKKI